MSLPILFVTSAFAIGLILLSTGVLLAWRDSVQRRKTVQVELQPSLLPEIGNIIERLESRISTHEHQRVNDMEHLRQNIAQMRADVEWLAGERMIEQAIEMCREGLTTERISQDLGMQPEDVRTLKLLRAH